MRFFYRLLVSTLLIGVLGFTAGCSDNGSETDPPVIDETETFREDIVMEGEEIYDEEVIGDKEDEISSETESLPPREDLSSVPNDQTQAIEFPVSTTDNEIVTIEECFQLDSVTVTIQVDIPDGWNYSKWDVEQEVPDWGLQIQIGDHENSIIMISGQHGTLNVSGMYPDPPEIFITNQGIEASYYKDEFEMDSGETYVNQHIVIGQMKSGFYGIILQMPREIYDDNIEPIQKLLESVKIVEN